MKRLFTAFLMLLLIGCSLNLGPIKPRPPQDSATRLMEATYAGVDRLLAAVPPDNKLTPGIPVIVATIAELDSLKSSRLGRLVSEHAATRLTTSGFPAQEVRLRHDILVTPNEGEFLLSRQAADISPDQRAQAVLVGSYTESRSHVFITLRLIGGSKNETLAAFDYALPLDATIRSLLWAAP
ncbi:MAG TPA: FlgO family outer membrane protein [Geobacterales bacterium]|nr:FlgO family outer membrane protein [Geobacterales bacterium]